MMSFVIPMPTLMGFGLGVAAVGIGYMLGHGDRNYQEQEGKHRDDVKLRTVYMRTDKEVVPDDMNVEELELIRWANAHQGKLVLGEFLQWKGEHERAEYYDG